MTRTSLGIDEAGRGPVLGSLFVGAVLVGEKTAEKWKNKGIKDSKQLPPEKREEWNRIIRTEAEEVHLKEINARQIDELRKVTNLNDIEISMMASAIHDAKQPDRIVIDLPEKNTEKFIAKIRKRSNTQTKTIIAEHRADATFPEVSAASIVAKVARDRHMAHLSKSFGEDLGSGYPHDEKTIQFVRTAVKKHSIPDIVRKTWYTTQKLIEENEQSDLDRFFS